MRRELTAITTLFASFILSAAHAAALPDTGQTLCDDGNNMVTCTSDNSGDASSMPRQDGRFGRDPAAGGSGFDYTKVCNSGELAGSGSCPADPALGSGADEWACTQDNLTGLMWEVKVDDGTLRDRDWTYTWYDSNTSTNGVNAGLVDTDTGVGSDNCLDDARCDSEKFVGDVNSATLCGYSDWRLPEKRELRSIVDLGKSSFTIDSTYFPYTQTANYYMSATTFAQDKRQEWLVYFNNGGDYHISDGKGGKRLIRLVRGGPF